MTKDRSSSKIKEKIAKYKPKGGLDYIANLFLEMAQVNHASTKKHSERVALLCEAVAKKMKKDCKAAFFAGLLHDCGKLLLPRDLFDGHEITTAEYEIIKDHAVSGFKALNKMCLFTAHSAGLHHNLCKAGYGVKIGDFPRTKNWSPATIKKVLEISMIVSICDFIDAFTNRTTKIKDGSDSNGKDLKEMLYGKYPEDKLVIDVALYCI